MKIVMLTHYFSPRIGGVEKVVEELANHLKGNEVIIIAEKHEVNLKEKRQFNKWTTIHRIEYPHKKYIGLLSIWLWLWKNRHLMQDADLVHVHDVFIWYLPFRLLFPFKPVYITYHGWEGKLPIQWTSVLQKKMAYYLSNGTMVVGKHLEKYNQIKADIVSYNGVHIPSNTIKKTPNSFVYVGRLSEETGLHLVLEVLQRMHKVQIEFVGDGELRKECEKYGKVHGFMKNPNQFMAKAQYCFAGGILNIQEALAHKCLVFVMYHNAIKKDYFIMAPFVKYIVIEGSPKKMAEKILYYQKHKAARKKMIDAGYQWVKGQTWEKVVGQYKRLWDLS